MFHDMGTGVGERVSGQVRQHSDDSIVYPEMTPLRYKEDRATQAAAYLLKLRGKPMSYMKLIKLMYFADREALLTLGRPITYDRWVSMQHGPVLSRTYDLISDEPLPGEASYWHKHISGIVGNREVELLSPNPPGDQLSEAQEKILEAVFKKWGKLSRYQVRDATHLLPEYTQTVSSIPISYRAVLLLEGRSEAEAREIESNLEAEEYLAQLAG